MGAILITRRVTYYSLILCVGVCVFLQLIPQLIVEFYEIGRY